jgi:agarase
MLAQLPKTPWGGIVDRASQSTGYFRIAERDGGLWLIDPDGGRFLSKGVNTVRFDQDQIQGTDRIPYAQACQQKYGSRQAWRAAAAQRLLDWGFNTLGSWSDEAVARAGAAPLALTPNLDLAMSYAWSWRGAAGKLVQDFPDVFDPDFHHHIGRRAREVCEAGSEDRAIIGWFIDNELRWGADWRGEDELLGIFLSLPSETPGRTAALAWLRERYPDFQKFNAVWLTSAGSWEALAALPCITPRYTRKPLYQRSAAEEEAINRANPARAQYATDCDAFAALVAERYFASTCAAIRAADPHHLVLGCRFAYPPAEAIIEAAARHSDVISFNCYDLDASASIDVYAASGRPCLIGEFSFRGADSGLPNTNGAGPVVASQAARAACFERYVTTALRKRSLVGYHWFEHADQPAEGRFDGENSNFGMVSIKDEVYVDLVQRMAAVNASAEALHESAVLVT